MPRIYIAQDPVLDEVLERASARLEDQGWEVVRGALLAAGDSSGWNPSPR